MASSSSIPKSPTPGKDPPFPSPSSSPPTRDSQTSPRPQIILPSNPDPIAKPLRPSPLRNSTPDSLHPSSAEGVEAQGQGQGQTSEPDVQKERPPFAPLFTLIHDPHTNTTHHPSRIHYIFSDDDDSLLTAACLRSLAPSASPVVSVRNSSTSSSSSATFRKTSQKGKEKEKEKVPREERVVVVEMGEGGDAVLGAASMSESWQVVGASVENAPTWEGTGGEEGGLMLRIEGVGNDGEMVEGIGLGIGDVERRKSGEGDEEEMQRLMESFDRKMVMLRRVVEAGEKAEKVGKEEE